MVGGKQIRLFGSLLAVCGDTPASNFLGGFKEGVGGAFRKCRSCMATGLDIQSKVMICTWK